MLTSHVNVRINVYVWISVVGRKCNSAVEVRHRRHANQFSSHMLIAVGLYGLLFNQRTTAQMHVLKIKIEYKNSCHIVNFVPKHSLQDQSIFFTLFHVHWQLYIQDKKWYTRVHTAIYNTMMTRSDTCFEKLI